MLTPKARHFSSYQQPTMHSLFFDNNMNHMRECSGHQKNYSSNLQEKDLSLKEFLQMKTGGSKQNFSNMMFASMETTDKTIPFSSREHTP